MPSAQGHFVPFGLTIQSRQISNNVLNLNGSKFKVMTFCRVNPIRSTYTLSGCPLDRITRVDDLGVLLDRKLKLFDNISTIVNKARGVLGLIKTWSKEFDDPYLTKTLFISLVHPILEYESPAWSPQYVVHSDRIESVKNKTSYILHKLGGKPYITSFFQYTTFN